MATVKRVGIPILKGVVLLLALNYLAGWLPLRLDLTEDGRYTLSDAAKNTLKDFEAPITVDVLLEGELPAEFLKLQAETEQILEEFGAENSRLRVEFVDPLEGVDDRETTINELQQIGLTPASVTIEEDGKVSQELVFPWAMVNFNDKTVKVPLLKNKLGATSEERVNLSVQQLEYAFADAFTKVGLTTKKKVAVIKGNNELDDLYLADFLGEIKAYYNIGAITLDSVASNPQQLLEQLKTFDLALIAKPTQPFSDPEKYVLDQYIVNGGRSLWLIDQVAMELDSLFNPTGSNLAINRDLNLNDFFFKFGIRLNTDLVSDLYNTPIVLATGDADASQYDPLPWVYHPMVFSRNDHPINNNIEALRLQFTGSIDTLGNSYNKTVLLSSSPLSKSEGIPRQIALSGISNKPDQQAYAGNGNLPLAVLVEGDFNSAFTNRVKPLRLKDAIEQGESNKMLVIADGDLIKNQIRQGRPLPLGYDKWTNGSFGNKAFLINSMNYLLDDTGLINIRNKKVAIALLDQKKIADQKMKWQLLNVLLPVGLLLIFGITANRLRKRKFAS
ncbi:MAG: gliding motility-associated ABC transporter substrate-binding protein GldG [Flavobacteriaceae bacterium]|nr:gliding motility-associated ABC transporter substrate-binding protein GldG [Flavobacteriaceae bacterium]